MTNVSRWREAIASAPRGSGKPSVEAAFELALGEVGVPWTYKSTGLILWIQVENLAVSLV